MGKKIIILNGSPRKNGNTALLIDAFVRGVNETENEVTVFNLQEMNIKPCLGCYGGGKDPKSPCVQKDDMDKIYPCFTEADIIVLASPLYYWSFSAQLKVAFDRLFAVSECNEENRAPKKSSILMMAAEGMGYPPMLTYYEDLVERLGWENLGAVLCGGVRDVGDIKGRPELEKAYRLGKSL